MKQKIEKSEDQQKRIIDMFNHIAFRYDLLNTFLSFGIHHLWKRKAIQKIQSKPDSNYLDLCCGTGDLSHLISKNNKSSQIVGVDLSESMLKIAQKKHPHIQFIKASATDLPFDSNSFNAVIIGFGIRNVVERGQAFKEIFRCLKPEGQLIILEFGIPQNKLFNNLYKFYFLKVLPTLGKIFSKHQYAYQYLPESTLKFPQAHDFLKEFESHQFIDLKMEKLFDGVAWIYQGMKPPHDSL